MADSSRIPMDGCSMCLIIWSLYGMAWCYASIWWLKIATQWLVCVTMSEKGFGQWPLYDEGSHTLGFPCLPLHLLPQPRAQCWQSWWGWCVIGCLTGCSTFQHTSVVIQNIYVWNADGNGCTLVQILSKLVHWVRFQSTTAGCQDAGHDLCNGCTLGGECNELPDLATNCVGGRDAKQHLAAHIRNVGRRREKISGTSFNDFLHSSL